MPEERVFPGDINDEGSIQNDQEETEDEEFFDPMPDEEDSQNNNNTKQIIKMSHGKKKAMLDFRCRVEDAILNNNIYGKHKRNDCSIEDIRDVKIWGVPLLPSKGHPGTDIVLMKFLKAKDYRVSEAFHMLRKTMKWRRAVEIDEVLDEEFSPEHKNMWSMDSGRDREGRPVCYYMLGALRAKEMRHRLLGSPEKYEEYTRWRIQCIERGIRKILFKDGAVNSIIQIVDLKNSPATAMKEVNLINKKMLTLVQEHYPGLIYKTMVINVPFWFMAFHALHLRLLTQRSRNKVLFVVSAKVTENLYKFINPENLPVHYDGLKRVDDTEFSTDDKVLEVNVKANSTTQIQIPANEADVTLTWDFTVVGHEVMYKEEFIPNDDCSYMVLLQKEKKMCGTVRNFFHIREPGKIVITIENGTFKKKKAFYRYNSKPSIPMYMFKKK